MSLGKCFPESFFGQGPEPSDPFGMNEKEERILEDC
jgi:hypothetical protein